MPGDLENLNKKVRELVDGMKTSFQKASASISGHVGDVMSDELKMTQETIKSFAGSAKESSMKILKFFGTGWTLELKSFAVDKKQLDVLEDIRDGADKERLSRLAKFKKTKGAKFLAAILDMLGIPLAILAAGLGAIIGQILIPFNAIYKILKPFLKLFVGLTKIGKLFTKIAATAKIAKMINAFKWLGGLFSFFLKLPGIRVIAKGLKLGFTKLLWPLQILLSVFDFIKGYMETEGNILDKIKGGMKNAIMKFINFPAYLIGKAVDWVFGMKAGTSEEAMIKGIKTAIDSFYKVFDTVFKPIKTAFNLLLEVLRKTTWKDVTDTLTNIRKWIEELPKKIYNWLKEMYNAGVKMSRPFLGEWLTEQMRIKGTPDQEAKFAEEKMKRENEIRNKKLDTIADRIFSMNETLIKTQNMKDNIIMDRPPVPQLPIVNQSEDVAIRRLSSYGGR